MRANFKSINIIFDHPMTCPGQPHRMCLIIYLKCHTIFPSHTVLKIGLQTPDDFCVEPPAYIGRITKPQDRDCSQIMSAKNIGVQIPHPPLSANVSISPTPSPLCQSCPHLPNPPSHGCISFVHMFNATRFINNHKKYNI